MDLFTLAAPVFDLAMKLSGHQKILAELGALIKADELKEDSDKNPTQFQQIQEKPNKKNEKHSKVRLIDLGGGTGELANYLPANLEVTVVDTSQAMLEKIKEKNFKMEVKYLLADGENLPFADDFFDYLTISDALHHFRQVEKALTESARVLKPGGKIYILEFDPETFFTKLIIFLEKLFGEPVNFYKAEKLSEMLGENGLKTEYEYLNKSLYVLKAEKPEY